MENNTLKFKTNINCMGCVSKVTPELDKLSAIENWEVDIRNKDKVLTVETSSDKESEVIAAVKKAGFKIDTEDLYQPYKYTVVEVDSAIPAVADFAAKYNLKYKHIKMLNPWLRDAGLVNKERKKYQIKILQPS